MNPNLSQTIAAETPEVWQILMEELNKVNQDSKLLKKAYKKKTQQNQVSVARAAQQSQATKAKTSTHNTGTKAIK